MCEDRGGRARVHRWLSTKDVIELGEGVDEDENIGGLEGGLIPEYHPCYKVTLGLLVLMLRGVLTGYTQVSDGIVRDKIHHYINLFLVLCALAGIELVETI